jgi:hypothetical protein
MTVYGMIFIFGVGHKTLQISELRETIHCNHCNNTTRWKISKDTTWFSLFFIPVIPVKTIYQEFCPICKTGHEISKNEYDKKLNKSISP